MCIPRLGMHIPKLGMAVLNLGIELYARAKGSFIRRGIEINRN